MTEVQSGNLVDGARTISFSSRYQYLASASLIAAYSISGAG
jgi:hypothetical protein